MAICARFIARTWSTPIHRTTEMATIGSLSDGRQSCPVVRPGFKPGEGCQPLLGWFDSSCFPPPKPRLGDAPKGFVAQLPLSRAFPHPDVAIHGHRFLETQLGESVQIRCMRAAACPGPARWANRLGPSMSQSAQKNCRMPSAKE